MIFKRTLPLIFLFISFHAFAQERKMGEIDSIRFYQDIENFSKKRGITKFLYRLVLKPVTPVNTPKNKKAIKLITPDFDLYNCKIIRNISIQVTDPFGYNLLDTIQKPIRYIQKKGNQLHITTRRFIVRNFLLFESGKEFEAYQVAESERLLRQSTLFRDVIIYPVPNSELKDSVDIIIRAIDRWSITADIAATSSALKIRLTDRNIGGFGHTFRNRFLFDESGLTGYSLRYNINRIGKSYMSAAMVYEEPDETSYRHGFTLLRPFYSPKIKWSYGLALFKNKNGESVFIGDTLYTVSKVSSTGYDLYISHSIELLHRGASFAKNAQFTNLILSIRDMFNNKKSFGAEAIDSLDLYHQSHYFLGMAALSTINFEQENFIFRFGEIEDIPLGKFIGIIGGVDPYRNSKYTGIRAGFSAYTNLHYFSAIGNWGKLFEANGNQQTAFDLNLTFFSPLLVAGDWKIRQFIRSNYTTGVNLPANKFLLLSSEPGLERVNNGPLIGYNKLTVSLQTQAYAPWQFIGFRFAPVVFLNGGLIATNRPELFNSKLYTSLGIGMILRNDYLINSSFQISISVFPNLFRSNDWYRFNDIQTRDFILPQIQQDLPDFVPIN